MSRWKGLIWAAGAAALACGGIAQGAQSMIDRWDGEVAEASRRFGVPQDWIRAVMRAESAGLTELGGRPIVSSAGAMGLMQLMPQTWSALHDRYDLGADPFDPHDNILAGTAYLRELYDRFGYPSLFAAYNAGPARYAAFRDAGRALPSETVFYLAEVAGRSGTAPPAPQDTGQLFFKLGPTAAPGAAPLRGGLFVVLSHS